MKEKLFMLLRLVATFVICFLIIYAFTFFGAWKLFESGNPILIEIGVALILSVFIFVINEITTAHEKKLKALEERVEKLEGTHSEKDSQS